MTATLRQLDLLDYAAAQRAEAERLRDEGIEAAAKKTGEVWTGHALYALKHLCETQPTVWAGDLRRAVPLTPRSPQGWALPWVYAHRWKWIDPLPVDKKPADWKDARRHRCDVFRSRLYRGYRAEVGA